ncbi:MAG: septum formation protein Maf [Chlamydiae bacterium]|nr:MAG: septum formation protein Maf [Chlamydiota bacterium]
MLVLASSSPRRAEILRYFSLPFIQHPSHFDESVILFHKDPESYAKELAEKKASLVTDTFSQEVVLAADTVVYFKEKIYNKPKNPEEAFTMLLELSNQWHVVITAVAVCKKDVCYSALEKSYVLFNPLTEEQIRLYHKSDPCLDKAGGYGIQGSGSILVNRIIGCYYNIIGLPINLVADLLSKMQVNLWHYLKKS